MPFGKHQSLVALSEEEGDHPEGQNVEFSIDLPTPFWCPSLKTYKPVI
jgi:hypothetical protein